jgi:hypothetical protein
MIILLTDYNEQTNKINETFFDKIIIRKSNSLSDFEIINSYSNDIIILADSEIIFTNWNIDYNQINNEIIYKININEYSYYIFKGLTANKKILQANSPITCEIIESYDYYIYVNGFWNGFVEKTDANHIEFFENILKKTKLANYKITNDINQANVLFESCFSKSVLDAKKWEYSIFYSGEPFLSFVEDPDNISDNNIILTKQRTIGKLGKYNIILFSEESKNNIINLPLFVYYIHGNNYLHKLISRPLVTKVPKHFCCFIVSNGGCEIRNKMFDMLNSYKKVHSYGKFNNNMGINLNFDYWTENYRKFISNYKFIICFENSKFGTYSTEKIINPYLASIIPIYWSSSNIFNFISKKSILFLENETEESYLKLINIIKELDNSNEKYLEFVNRSIVDNNGLEYWENNYSIKKLAEQINKLI